MLAPLLDCTRAAGAAILQIYDAVAAGINCELKEKAEGMGPLTLADLAAHRILCAGLKAIDGSIPVVSEEDPSTHDLRHPTGRFWLIDPLDGTKEFIARTGEFTVNVALIENGAPTLGIVFAPALNELFWGQAGLGAYKDAGDRVTRIQSAQALGAPALRVVASRSHLDDATRAFISRAADRHTLVQAGSSIKFCRVAEGAADLYPRFGPTCEWDVAAAQAILEAASGGVTTSDGARLLYGKPSLLNPAFVAWGQAARDLATTSMNLGHNGAQEPNA
ncbi:3'(2'),5'-bisphosphate nucleotidase CysQ [Achromobacter denitrificans]|uniref:3'(2'),5'-bisphosphate nucleotidase CysQ n=1 Tax=Achromobacter denitrificans TaxID=32002 RepID=UPI000F662AEF|nr:3'(2'),5'-bisphosphate nucleotidase CysQ [Achromobacter denitrificans]RSE89149.1 3'(2'),5'-bisphosphate nucleotidase [Achromobacter denitrificans]